MLRYHKLLAGASWMGEYGDPDDPVEGAYLIQSIPLGLRHIFLGNPTAAAAQQGLGDTRGQHRA